ncbi:MAG: hypothetical protein AB1453_10985 [Chloroflexota bacterium]
MKNSKSRVQRLIFFGIVVSIFSALLLACQLGERPNNAGSQAIPSNPSPYLIHAATVTTSNALKKTAAITSTPSRTPRPTRTVTTAPSQTPSLPPANNPTPTPLIAKAEMLQLVHSMQNLRIGLLDKLFIQNNSTIFVSGSFGVTRLDLLANESGIARFRIPVIGLDRAGKVWFLSDNGFTITSWDGNHFDTYSQEQGWILQAQTNNLIGLIQSEPFNSREKYTWLVTARDVRQFDGKRWRVFTATEIGIPIPYIAGIQTVFTLGVDPISDQVWLGSCDWRSQQPIGGGGLWHFSDNKWKSFDFPVSNECITNIKVDYLGNLWITSPTSLYHQTAGEWNKFIPFSQQEHGFNFYWIEKIWLDPKNRALVLVTFFNERGIPTEKKLIIFQDKNFIALQSFPPLEDVQLFFTANQNMLVFNDHKVYRYSDDSDWQIISELPYQSVTQDANKTIWLISSSPENPALWIIRE